MKQISNNPLPALGRQKVMSSDRIHSLGVFARTAKVHSTVLSQTAEKVSQL